MEVRGERQFGQWDSVIRVLAGYDPDEYDRVIRWSLRDALLAFEHHLKGLAQHQYEQACLQYAAIAPYAKADLKAPELPPLLRGERD